MPDIKCGKRAGAEEIKTLETPPRKKAPVVLFGKGMDVGEIQA